MTWVKRPLFSIQNRNFRCQQALLQLPKPASHEKTTPVCRLCYELTRPQMTKKLLEIFFTGIALLAFALWGLLTIAVVLFLLGRWANPQTKGISNRDLVDYLYISLVLLPIYGAWLIFKVTVRKS
jgi:nitrate reductase NapE component